MSIMIIAMFVFMIVFMVMFMFMFLKLVFTPMFTFMFFMFMLITWRVRISVPLIVHKIYRTTANVIFMTDRPQFLWCSSGTRKYRGSPTTTPTGA